MHLYLPLKGEQSKLQIDVIANLLKRDPTREVLIGGGWCYQGGYEPQDGPETFSPDYLSSELREKGVERIWAFSREEMPRFWWMNVVSTWGEVKQEHFLLRSIVCAGHLPVKLQFVGVRSHMERAVWLWKSYNALMRMFGCGLDILEYEIVEIENKMGDDWAKGEGFRNLIAFIDPFGIGPALLIHMLRRWQARGAYMCD